MLIGCYPLLSNMHEVLEFAIEEVEGPDWEEKKKPTEEKDDREHRNPSIKTVKPNKTHKSKHKPPRNAQYAYLDG